MAKTHKSKRKKKGGNPYFRQATNKAVKGIVTAGIVLPLTFGAIKAGANVLPAVGRGAESLGSIGSK